MAVPECQPTIKKVLKRLAKGKGFPTCRGADGIKINSQLGSYRFNTDGWNEVIICPDKKTPPYASYKVPHDSTRKHVCRYIDIKVPIDIAADKQHENQRYYYTKEYTK